MAPASGPRILITTTNNPSEQSRTFSKLLRHILSNTIIINRGNSSLDDLFQKAVDENCNFIYMIHSKENRLDKLVIYKITKNEAIPERLILKFNQYIDHKIYGFHSLPESGPVSTSLETRALDPELIDYFCKYWEVELGKKNTLWLALDEAEHKRTSYISLVDALTQKKFFYAELQLVVGRN